MPATGAPFDFDHLYNSMWLVVITMTTVGYGDIYPRTHFGRFFGVVACLIGMLLVSYLIVGMSTLYDFQLPQERKAYLKIKKLTATDHLRSKAANVLKTALRYKRQQDPFRKFIEYMLLRHHNALFRNESKAAHSRLLATDQMVRNIDDKLRADLREAR